jgi:hypothetical protein
MAMKSPTRATAAGVTHSTPMLPSQPRVNRAQPNSPTLSDLDPAQPDAVRNVKQA